VPAPAGDHSAQREIRNLAVRLGQLLEASGATAEQEALSGYVDRALRRVQIELEELLAETRRRADSDTATLRVPRPPRNYAARPAAAMIIEAAIVAGVILGTAVTKVLAYG
jgi:hypothetical protein